MTDLQEELGAAQRRQLEAERAGGEAAELRQKLGCVQQDVEHLARDNETLQARLDAAEARAQEHAASMRSVQDFSGEEAARQRQALEHAEFCAREERDALQASNEEL